MKRIVICSDGTWNSPEDEQPTNILRLSRAIAPVDAIGNRQVVFYDWGVGTDRKKATGGITGAGIDKNIVDCYRFIVHNYDPGDELFFFGFSRGAYTVRSLGGFIRNCGILKREHADRIPSSFNHYRARSPSSHPDNSRSMTRRAKYAVADRTRIDFVGVLDTVGKLGIPITFWGLLDNDKYLFHDTSPSSIINAARHALAIDENREDFMPVPWDDKPDIDLKQVWFAGAHSDVGGGYADDHRLADIACAWLLQEAQAEGLEVEAHLPDRLRPKATARQHDPRKGIFKLRGRQYRDIHDSALIHRSVKERVDRLKSRYRSPALRAFLRRHGNDWSDVNLVDVPIVS